MSKQTNEGRQRRSSNNQEVNNRNVLNGCLESYMNPRAIFSIWKYPCQALSVVLCTTLGILRPGYSFLTDPTLKLPNGLQASTLQSRRAQVILLKGKLITSVDCAGSPSSTLSYFGERWGPSWKSRRLDERIPLQSQVSNFSLEREHANDSTSADGWGWYGPMTCNVTERFGLLFPRSVPEVLIWANGL